jgi:hypothetical protein
MASKRRPPLSRDMSEYLGLDAQGRHALAWPSCSRPGVRHFTLGVYNRALSCTCEAYVYHPERPCLHMLAYPDALRHHLYPPPADPGGAALDRAQADADDEADAWEADLRRVRHDEGLRALYGD